MQTHRRRAYSEPKLTRLGPLSRLTLGTGTQMMDSGDGSAPAAGTMTSM